MATIFELSLPRRLGWRTVLALFLACVAAILGAVPGWSVCFAVWLVVSWLVLGAVVLSTTGLVLVAVFSRAWARLRTETRQLVVVMLLMLAMFPMGLESRWVEFAEVRAGLQAHADASARAGGPRLAMTSISGEDWPMPGSGFVYDPDGVIATPESRRPAAWKDNPALAALSSRECFSVTPFVGSYYRWSNACDGL